MSKSIDITLDNSTKIIPIEITSQEIIPIEVSIASLGSRGYTGEQGIQGIQGVQGIQGNQGIQGIQGIQGLKGNTGSEGDKGDIGLSIIGEQGIQGIQGLKGDKGDKGDIGISVTGEQGIQGEKGDKGDAGIPQATNADTVDGLHASSFMKYDDIIMNDNAFGGKKLFFSNLSNALFNADLRWTVTGVIYNEDGTVFNASFNTNSMFNGNYDGGGTIPMGKYLVILIDFNGYFPQYPYGTVFLSHYHTSYTQSAKMRVYCNYEPHGIGWHEYAFSDYIRNNTTNLIMQVRQPKYAISLMEITIYAPPTFNSHVTVIDFKLDRPSTGNEMPFVDKYKANRLYYPLTVPTATLSGHAVNKGYVDTNIANLQTTINSLTARIVALENK